MADDEVHNHDFSAANADASLTYPMQCSALRKNGLVVIKGRPCKIVDMSTSKTGKHGHAKVHLVGIDIFNDKKMEELCPSTHNMDVPNFKTESFEVFGITDDGFLYLIDKDGETSEDMKLPGGELGELIRKSVNDGVTTNVTVTSAMGIVEVTKVDIAKG